VAAYLNPLAFCAAGSTLSAAQGGGTCPSIASATGNPAQSLDGDLQRDGLTGPGFKDVNMSLFRDFGIYGRVKLQIRAEAMNVFNLVNLGLPGSALNGATFGKITGGPSTSTAPTSLTTPPGFQPRVLQFGARITF